MQLQFQTFISVQEIKERMARFEAQPKACFEARLKARNARFDARIRRRKGRFRALQYGTKTCVLRLN